MTPWKPGQAGNPRGRKRGGAYVSEWLNAFLITDETGKPKYNLKKLAKIAAKGTAPAMVMAAQRILTACRNPIGENGKIDPEPGRAMEGIMSRLEGKPNQSVTVEHIPDRSLAEVEAHLSHLLADPRVKTLLSMAEAAAVSRALPMLDAGPTDDEQGDQEGDSGVRDDGE